MKSYLKSNYNYTDKQAHVFRTVYGMGILISYASKGLPLTSLSSSIDSTSQSHT